MVILAGGLFFFALFTKFHKKADPTNKNIDQYMCYINIEKDVT